MCVLYAIIILLISIFHLTDWREYMINQLPFLTDQVSPKKLIPSIIVLNAKGLCNSSGTISKEVTPSPSMNDFKDSFIVECEQPNSWLSLTEYLLFSRVIVIYDTFIHLHSVPYFFIYLINMYVLL